jgi:hypothetical protein
MKTSHSDVLEKSERLGRAVLGCLLESPGLWSEASELNRGDFRGYNEKVFAAIKELNERNCIADATSVAAQLGEQVPAGYVDGLDHGVVCANFGSYVRQLREATQHRQRECAIEQLQTAKTKDERRQIMERIQALEEPAGQDWRTLFHTYEDVMNAPPARFAIEGFLQEEGITFIGGLAGHGTTLCMLAMTRALLEGGKLFHHFAVNKPAERVIYLIPEAGLGPFSARLKNFHLEEYVRDGRLFCHTLSAPRPLLLTDPRLLDAAKGADVFLDTAIRFMVGDENSAAEQKLFADTLFALQRAGARTITGAHHSPKSFGSSSFMTLENVLRGSGDIGAMLATCWGLSQIDATSTRVFVQNVKARDFAPCEPFIIQGRPSINETGYFELTNPPGFAGTLGTL